MPTRFITAALVVANVFALVRSWWSGLSSALAAAESRMRWLMIVSLLAASSLSIWTADSLAWVENGVPVSTALDIQEDGDAASDGAGGAIIAWKDTRSSSFGDIYAQRVDQAGNPVWAYDGISVCQASSYQDNPSVVVDGGGGAIIAWQDRRGAVHAIYAQRVDALGVTQWTTDGVLVCSSSASMQDLVMTDDGLGGAIMAWSDIRSGTPHIYAQRIDGSGSVMWNTSGVRVCTSDNMQTYARITADGPGEAIIIWSDSRNYEVTSTDIYAQRVNFLGSPSWPSAGVAVCSSDGLQSAKSMAASPVGGAIITWEDNRGGADGDIYAQYIGSAGTAQWASQGLAICTEASDQSQPVVVSGESGDALVFWSDLRGADADLYAQRVSQTGNPQWPTDGIQIVDAVGHQNYPQAVADGAGGALVFYSQDLGEPNASDIHCCRVDAMGSLTWSGLEMPVCTMPNDQYISSLVPDGIGSAIVVMEDHRAGWDVYAQRIEGRYGYWGLPEPVISSVVDNPADQGGYVVLNWAASERDVLNLQTITHYSIWRATDALPAKHGDPGTDRINVALEEIGRDFAGPAFRVEDVGGEDYYWEWLGNQDAIYAAGYSFLAATRQDSIAGELAQHYFQVVAHTTNPFRFWASLPDSGYSVDNLAPAMPVALKGRAILPAGGLRLHWDPNPEADLYGYAVYRGGEGGWEPEPTSLLAMVTDTSFVDAEWHWGVEYRYKVAARDIHGNEGPAAALSPDAITGIDEMDISGVFFLAQNKPNPFNPQTMINYDLPRDSLVRLSVYDVAGRLVRTLVDGEEISAGRWKAVWDGRDWTGRAVASGIYFCRLKAGDYRASIRMTLVK